MQANDFTEQPGLSPKMRIELAEIGVDSINWDVSMADYCTFRTGGNVEAIVKVTTREQLVDLVQWLAASKISWRVIGRGSNVLVQSSGFKGVFIVLGGELAAIELVPSSGADGIQLRVGAGCSVSRLVGWCCENEVSGTEFLVGIPGSVGGAVYMNAGAWGNEIGERVDSVAVISVEGKMESVPRNDLNFSYRALHFKDMTVKDSIIIETVLSLKAGKEREIISRCKEYQKERRAKQPLGVASAGSFFRNPPGDTAGRLIDNAGLKGLRKGDAMVSTKHANFIVNTGQASPDDIVELMKEVQQKVFQHSGIKLEPEVQLL